MHQVRCCLIHKVRLRRVGEDHEFSPNPTLFNWTGTHIHIFRCPIDNKDYRLREVYGPNGKDLEAESKEVGLLPIIELSVDVCNSIQAASKILKRIKEGNEISSEMINSVLEDLDKLLRIVEEEKSRTDTNVQFY